MDFNFTHQNQIIICLNQLYVYISGLFVTGFYGDVIGYAVRTSTRSWTRKYVYLKDNVKVYNIKGDTLFCKELTWDQNLERFYTDKPVRINTPDLIMYGEGLSAPQDFKTFEIYKVTNSIIRVQQ